jgi:hypothetical protein
MAAKAITRAPAAIAPATQNNKKKKKGEGGEVLSFGVHVTVGHISHVHYYFYYYCAFAQLC